MLTGDALKEALDNSLSGGIDERAKEIIPALSECEQFPALVLAGMVHMAQDPSPATLAAIITQGFIHGARFGRAEVEIEQLEGMLK